MEIFIELTRVSASRCEARTFHARVRNLDYARAFHSLSARSNSWLNIIVLRSFGYNCRIELRILTLVDAKMTLPLNISVREAQEIEFDLILIELNGG